MAALHRLSTVWGVPILNRPDPVGVFNGHPVWRRTDVEPLTLFNERKN